MPKPQIFYEKFIENKIVFMPELKFPSKFQINKIYESRNKKIMHF